MRMKCREEEEEEEEETEETEETEKEESYPEAWAAAYTITIRVCR